MNRLSLEKASKRLGYRNDSHLSKLENAYGCRPPSLSFMVRAAKLYGVSLDWLCGLVEDFDPDENHDRISQIVEHFFDVMSVTRKVEIQTVCKISRRVTALEKNALLVAQSAMKSRILLDDAINNGVLEGMYALKNSIGETAWLSEQTYALLSGFLKHEPAQVDIRQADIMGLWARHRNGEAE